MSFGAVLLLNRGRKREKRGNYLTNLRLGLETHSQRVRNGVDNGQNRIFLDASKCCDSFSTPSLRNKALGVGVRLGKSKWGLSEWRLTGTCPQLSMIAYDCRPPFRLSRFGRGHCPNLSQIAPPNLRRTGCTSFRTSEEGCAKLSQCLSQTRKSISGNVMQVPFSNALL